MATLELELDWPSVATPPSADVGTDLLIHVRDRRLVDRGVVVGAQVKTGRTVFARPSTKNQPEGWWYREPDKSHFDYWLEHDLPQLLILHDVQAATSYWAHVTPDAVVDTGQGAKILVPAANTLDAAHLDELLAVAGTGRLSVPLEGSAWTGAVPPASSDRLRFALLVPRVSAPHPNAGPQAALTPFEAVGLLLQARLDEYDRYARDLESIPAPGEIQETADWHWRFVDALYRRVTESDLDPMRALIDEALDSASAAAAAVVVASRLIDCAQPEEALVVLGAVLAPDDVGPVDYAWLQLQRARALTELGDLDAARDTAVDAQTARSTSHHDLTATAISGAAAVILFNTASWAQRDVGKVIERADTTATWWRTQMTSRGTTAALERTFKQWAPDAAITFGEADEANNQLYVAALNAGLLGDQGAWRHLTSLLGQDSLVRLSRHSAVDDVASGLSLLRLAGDEKALRLAIRRVANNGPAAAVTQAGSEVNLEASTRTTVLADLAFVAAGGDLLEPDIADAAGRWILSAIDNPLPFVKLTSTHFGDVEAELIERLTGLTQVAPHLGVELVERSLPPASETREPIRVKAWRQFLRAMPRDAWTPASIRGLRESDALADDVRGAVLGLAADQDQAAREELIDQVREGSLVALQSLGGVTELPSDAAAQLLEQLVPALEEEQRAVRDGSLGFGPFDRAQCVALVIGFHPNEAATEALLDYLADDQVPRHAKREAFRVLASNRTLLEPERRTRLADIADRARHNTAPMDDTPFEDSDIVGPAGFIVGLMSDDERRAAEEFARLLAGSADHREWAVALAAASETELAGVLPGLIEDDHPEVRRAAAAELATQVANGTASEAAAAALTAAADDPGRFVPLGIANSLSNLSVPTPRALNDLLHGLTSHPSALVRAAAAKALAG